MALARASVTKDSEPKFVVRRVMDGRVCQACLDNDDPDALKVHPGCRCWKTLDHGVEEPHAPDGSNFGRDAHGDEVDGFTRSGPDTPGAGYVVPVSPETEQMLHPEQVTPDFITNVRQINLETLHLVPDAYVAAWVTSTRVVIGIVRYFTDAGTARKLGRLLGAAVFNLRRRAIFGRFFRRGTKAARPILVLLPRRASKADVLAFIATIHAN